MIDAQRDSYPLGMSCRSLEVSRSGYADWQVCGKGMPGDAEHRLVAKIRMVHAQGRGTSGLFTVAGLCLYILEFGWDTWVDGC